MRLERVLIEENPMEIVSTGATFALTPDGSVSVRSRIPSARALFRLAPEPARGWRLKTRDDRSVTLAGGPVDFEIRDDSLLIIRANEPCSITIERMFAPEYSIATESGAIWMDELGGLGVFSCGGRAQKGVGRLAAAGRIGVLAGDELWIHVFPSRWPCALRHGQSIAHEGRPRAPYPSARVIAEAARSCQVFALHAYFWRETDRSLRPVFSRYAWRRCPWLSPRHEPSDFREFARVKNQVAAAGMKLVVYLSPRYSSAPDFASETRRVVDELGVDGVYLDGLPADLAHAYALVRDVREILGSDRILYLHPSAAGHDPRVPTTFIDTHADFVLRGSEGKRGLPLETFLRYCISGWNTSNAVGVWCHYGSSGTPVAFDRVPPRTHVDSALARHVRLWRRSFWWGGASRRDAFDRHYAAGLERIRGLESKELADRHRS